MGLNDRCSRVIWAGIVATGGTDPAQKTGGTNPALEPDVERVPARLDDSVVLASVDRRLVRRERRLDELLPGSEGRIEEVRTERAGVDRPRTPRSKSLNVPRAGS
jgi:hypothetical protein